MSAAPLPWADTARESAFLAWLKTVAPAHQINPESVRLASADASFRRYFRVDGEAGGVAATFIIMDAPPAQEDCRPFVNIAALMRDAGVPAPRVLAWDAPQGFMLLTDLGAQTMMEVISPPLDVHAIAEPTAAHHALYLDAVDVLLRWQLASKPGVLPPCDDALLSRELNLFPEWYVKRHRGVALDGGLQDKLDGLFAQIRANNLNSLGGARVFVHRDFMPRNLMVLDKNDEAGRSAGPPQARPAPQGGRELREANERGGFVSAVPPQAKPAPTSKERGSDSPKAHAVGSVGALDFQDAVYGPITYDIASLMRDAFLSWNEDFVLDITVRYWQQARKAGLPVGDDFGEFYRAVEWMGLQRHLKILGIFARLTLRDGKPKYLADTPRFLRYARATCSRYRELVPLLALLDQIEGTEVRVGYTF